MAKQKKTSKTDNDTLKHYIALDVDQSQGIDPELLKQPHIKELLDKAMESKPEFIKAKIAVDRLMSDRKNAVIKHPPRKKDA
jgi:hypothetical protein